MADVTTTVSSTPAAPTAQTTTVSTSPGYKTTEFWLSAVASVIGLLYGSGVIAAGGAADHWIGFAVAALASMGYSVSRGIAKS